MPHRIYTDTQGHEWSVWDIHPEEVERQLRREGIAPTPQVGARPRMAVSSDLMSGWLCFESADTKRRLMPIPPGWHQLSDAELEQLCATAVDVRLPRLRRPRGPDAATA